jgi:hypothetical protein
MLNSENTESGDIEKAKMSLFLPSSPNSVLVSPTSTQKDTNMNVINLSPGKAESELQLAPSHPNFAWKLFKKLFNLEECAGKNVHGKAGKDKLDDKKILTIRKNVFRFWSVPKAQEYAIWRKCEIAIDKGIRNYFLLKRKKCPDEKKPVSESLSRESSDENN